MKPILMSFAAACVFAGCTNAASVNTAAAPAAPAASPLISEGAIAEMPGVTKTVLADSLANPWGLAFLPDGTMLITEKAGALRVVRDGKLVPEPVPGMPAIPAIGQGGLMDIAVDPDFATTGHLFFTVTEGTPDANMTTVARARFDGTKLSDWTVIWRNPRTKAQGQHFGARIQFLADKTMLVSIGDGGNRPASIDGEWLRLKAQQKDFAFGKILRMDRNGKAPADNPFPGAEGVEAYVYSYGHRNVQGIALDPKTGTIFANEHGSKGGDELNRVVKGGNFGWPFVTHATEYNGPKISEETSRPGMEDPLLVWMGGTAPSGLAVYRGTAFPQLDGNILTGGLKTNDVRRVRLDASGKVISEEAINFGERVRDVRVGPDGLIYVLTENRSGPGKLHRVAPAA